MQNRIFYCNIMYLIVVCQARSQNCKTLTIRLVMSDRPSVRMHQLGFKRTDFREMKYSWILRKSVENIQVSLQSEKNGR